MFDKDMGNAIQKACTQDLEVMQVAKTAQLLRREIFNPFSGAFESRPHHNSELFLLKTLGMISSGPGSIEESSSKVSQHQAVLTRFPTHRRERRRIVWNAGNLTVIAVSRKELICFYFTSFFSLSSENKSYSLQPCTHEGRDSRIIHYVKTVLHLDWKMLWCEWQTLAW